MEKKIQTRKKHADPTKLCNLNDAKLVRVGEVTAVADDSSTALSPAAVSCLRHEIEADV